MIKTTVKITFLWNSQKTKSRYVLTSLKCLACWVKNGQQTTLNRFHFHRNNIWQFMPIFSSGKKFAWKFRLLYIPPPKGMGDILFLVWIPLALASASHFLVWTISFEPVVGFIPNFHGYNWNITKNWLDLDLVFKITAVEKLKIQRASALVLIGVGVALSCLHNILWTSSWILTKCSWIYNRGITKNWSDFGDLDLIFKVTAVEKLKTWWGTSVFSENTVTSFLCFLESKKKISICCLLVLPRKR